MSALGFEAVAAAAAAAAAQQRHYQRSKVGLILKNLEVTAPLVVFQFEIEFLEIQPGLCFVDSSLVRSTRPTLQVYEQRSWMFV